MAATPAPGLADVVMGDSDSGEGELTTSEMGSDDSAMEGGAPPVPAGPEEAAAPSAPPSTDPNTASAAFAAEDAAPKTSAPVASPVAPATFAAEAASASAKEAQASAPAAATVAPATFAARGAVSTPDEERTPKTSAPAEATVAPATFAASTTSAPDDKEPKNVAPVAGAASAPEEDEVEEGGGAAEEEGELALAVVEGGGTTNVADELPPQSDAFGFTTPALYIPEVWQLRASLTANPRAFEEWLQLVKLVEAAGSLEEVRGVYTAFLGEFPLCWGYWKRLADLEREAFGHAAALAAYEQASTLATPCVDLWVHFIDAARAAELAGCLKEADVRDVCERAILNAGLDWRAAPLWLRYLDFEQDGGRWRQVGEVFRRALRVPMEGLLTIRVRLRSLVVGDACPAVELLCTAEEAEALSAINAPSVTAATQWDKGPLPSSPVLALADDSAAPNNADHKKVDKAPQPYRGSSHDGVMDAMDEEKGREEKVKEQKGGNKGDEEGEEKVKEQKGEKKGDERGEETKGNDVIAQVPCQQASKPQPSAAESDLEEGELEDNDDAPAPVPAPASAETAAGSTREPDMSDEVRNSSSSSSSSSEGEDEEEQEEKEQEEDNQQVDESQKMEDEQKAEQKDDKAVRQTPLHQAAVPMAGDSDSDGELEDDDPPPPPAVDSSGAKDGKPEPSTPSPLARKRPLEATPEEDLRRVLRRVATPQQQQRRMPPPPPARPEHQPFRSHQVQPSQPQASEQDRRVLQQLMRHQVLPPLPELQGLMQRGAFLLGHDRLRILDVADPKQRQLQARKQWLLDIRDVQYLMTYEEAERLRPFEANLKRHYFHNKRLSEAQLATWRAYLDFEEVREPQNQLRLFALYKRCLVAANNYLEFWLRLAGHFERAGLLEDARALFEGACTCGRLRHRADAVVVWAQLEEQCGRQWRARELLDGALAGCGRGSVEVAMHRIAIERRCGDLQASEALLLGFMNNAQDLASRSYLSRQYARFCEDVLRRPEQARAALLGAWHLGCRDPGLLQHLAGLLLRTGGAGGAAFAAAPFDGFLAVADGGLEAAGHSSVPENAPLAPSNVAGSVAEAEDGRAEDPALRGLADAIALFEEALGGGGAGGYGPQEAASVLESYADFLVTHGGPLSHLRNVQARARTARLALASHNSSNKAAANLSLGITAASRTMPQSHGAAPMGES